MPLVVTLAAGRSWTARLLASGTAVWLGEVSYFIYLVHQPIGTVRGPIKSLLETVYIPRLFTMAGFVALALALPVSAAKYYWIERPARDWTCRLMRRAHQSVRS